MWEFKVFQIPSKMNHMGATSKQIRSTLVSILLDVLPQRSLTFLGTVSESSCSCRVFVLQCFHLTTFKDFPLDDIPACSLGEWSLQPWLRNSNPSTVGLRGLLLGAEACAGFSQALILNFGSIRGFDWLADPPIQRRAKRLQHLPLPWWWNHEKITMITLKEQISPSPKPDQVYLVSGGFQNMIKPIASCDWSIENTEREGS